MKKIKRYTVLLAVILLIAGLATSLVACNKNKLDPEKRPFSMSIQNPDGVFNPFFSTSAYDSSIISLTQISMLNTDKDGNIVCGEDEPTVALAYNITENKNGADSKTTSTTYEFLIKKGIKWSNGSDLTVLDVLFNLYVYLDPTYTGSATIYSTDIVGLQNYRQQTDDALSDDATSTFERQFRQEANKRVSELVNFIMKYDTDLDEDDKNPLPAGYDENKARLDFAGFAREFYKELTADYNAIDMESYKKWEFKAPWQVFFLNDGSMTELLAKNPDQTYVKDEEGNFKLDVEAANGLWEGIRQELVAQHFSNADIAAAKDGGGSDDVKKAVKNYCIDSIFDTYFADFPDEILTRNTDKLVFSDDDHTKVQRSVEASNYSDFKQVANYWASSETMLEKFAAEAKSDFFRNNEKVRPNIEGIRVRKENREFHYQYYEDGVVKKDVMTLDQDYDVLRIEINDVDPKAIYNFALTISPMYYYSTHSWNSGNGNKDYIQAAIDDFKENGYGDNMSEFGIEFGNSNFMSEVVNASSKVGVPVGGGPYIASTENGGAATNKDQFFRNNQIYYERNPYFETLGKGIENAKIKSVKYKVVNSDQILNAVGNNEIDLGDPNATKENVDSAERKGLNHIEVKTSGYGYVGINPRFVPSVSVRRAIMMALDADTIIDNYYKGGLGERIWRPMSNTSWAYPREAREYTAKDGTKYEYDGTAQKIKQLVEADGYTLGTDGVYYKNIKGFGDDKLDYKFTIAGGSTDHPAYAMFLKAEQILNSIGFNVKTVTSQTALTDLSAGKLEVWAAAWSATIDPDMYQVYHMDSNASSTKNWGYTQILNGQDSVAWSDEYEIVVELSKFIDKGRQTTNQLERKDIYAKALDLVMELAVEFPTYQRKDMTVYRKDLLDPNTLPKDCTPYSGLLARIWEINYVGKK